MKDMCRLPLAFFLNCIVSGKSAIICLKSNQISPQKLFMMDDREVVSTKLEDPRNSVEFQAATLAWEKARAPAMKPPPNEKNKNQPKKGGGMKRVLRREKLSLYISTEDDKGNKETPNAQSLLTNMEQESPQSTISSTQSIRPPLQKTLHRISLNIKKVQFACILVKVQRKKRTKLKSYKISMTSHKNYCF